MNKTKKRFIAGAVCPKCAAQDSIVVYTVDDSEFRECVECDFKDKMVFKQHQRELETRVNTTEEELKAETQVLEFPPKS